MSLLWADCRDVVCCRTYWGISSNYLYWAHDSTHISYLRKWYLRINSSADGE